MKPSPTFVQKSSVLARFQAILTLLLGIGAFCFCFNAKAEETFDEMMLLPPPPPPPPEEEEEQPAAEEAEEPPAEEAEEPPAEEPEPQPEKKPLPPVVPVAPEPQPEEEPAAPPVAPVTPEPQPKEEPQPPVAPVAPEPQPKEEPQPPVVPVAPEPQPKEEPQPLEFEEVPLEGEIERTPKPIPAAKPKEPKEETPQESEQTAESADIDLSFLPAASEPEERAASEQSKGFMPVFEWGGEARTRLGLDLANEYSLVRDDLDAAPDHRGMEDVVDFRNSVSFWARLKMKRIMQAYLEVYAEHFVVGKRNETDPTVIFNGRDYRADFLFELKEAYLDFYWKSFDLRVGNQIISWGTMATMSPSNRINPADVSAFYWADVSGARKPLFALKAVYHYSDLNFELVWIPFHMPPPVDAYGGDYSLYRYGSAYGGITTMPMPNFDLFLSQTKSSGAYPEVISTKDPSANPVNSQAGFRFSGMKKGVEFGLSYLFMFEEIPQLYLDNEVRAMGQALMRNNLGLAAAYAQSLYTRLMKGEKAENLVLSEYHRKHSVAAEFGMTLWELGVKAEMAFLPDKTYYTSGLRPTEHHTLSYAAGIDVMKMDLGEVSTLYLDVELFGSVIFGLEPNERLLFNSDKNLGVYTTFRIAFLDDDLEFEAVNQVNFSTQDWVLVPRVSYSPVTNFNMTLGFLLLDAWGHEPAGFSRYHSNPDRKDSLFGQFSNNDQAFLLFKYYY